MASKTDMRTETGNFLRKVPNNNNSFNFQTESEFLSLISDSLSLNDRQQKALTGAAPAILPMQIVTSRVISNGKGQEAVERISFTMLINPDSWNHGKTFLTQAAYTRRGWAPQLWGPNQDTISSTGRTAAFLSPTIGLDTFRNGLTFSYLNFMSLVGAYRNNGYQFQDYRALNQMTRVIKTVQGVQIMYDNEIYMGHFSNFTIDEVEESPYVQNYNFEFIISALTGSEFEVRGHYRPIPLSDAQMDIGTSADPNTIVFASDPFLKGSSNPVVIPTYTQDVTTMRLWERKTGRPWSDAFAMGLTDGSSTSNAKLLAKLLKGEIAQFKRYVLKVVPNGRGSVRPSEDMYVNYGEKKTIIAIPETGHHLDHWSGPKTATIAEPTLVITTVSLTDNATVTANFVPNIYTLTLVKSGAGNVSPPKTQVTYGDSIIISAVPDVGNHFVKWTFSSSAVAIDDPLAAITTAKVINNAVVTAHFAANI